MDNGSGNRWGARVEILSSQKHFEDWVDEYLSGDHEAAQWIVDNAIDMLQEHMDNGTPPIMVMFIAMQALTLAAASCDMDTKMLKEFIQAQAVPMYDSARYLIQRRDNEKDEVIKRGSHLTTVQ